MLQNRQRVLLVNTPLGGTEQFFPPMDHAYFKSLFTTPNWDSLAFDLNQSFSHDKLFDSLNDLCESFTLAQVTHRIERLVDLVATSDPHLVVLPYHLSIDSKDTILFSSIVQHEISRRSPKVDFVFHGSFCKKPSTGLTPFGLCLTGKSFGRTFSLPPADFSDYNLDQYRTSFLPILASAGCPNNCVFCVQVERRYGRKCHLYRTPKEVVDEILAQHERHQTGHFYFADDNIAANPSLFHLVSEMKSFDFEVVWGGESDAITDRNLLSAAYESGCRFLFFGLESASSFLRSAMRKRHEMTLCESFLDEASSLGISVYCYLIINHPLESQIDVEQTLKFLSENQEKVAGIFVAEFCPFVDSYVAKHPSEFGIKMLAETKYKERLNRRAREVAYHFGAHEILSYPNDWLYTEPHQEADGVDREELMNNLGDVGIRVYPRFIDLFGDALTKASES